MTCDPNPLDSIFFHLDHPIRIKAPWMTPPIEHQIWWLDQKLLTKLRIKNVCLQIAMQLLLRQGKGACVVDVRNQQINFEPFTSHEETIAVEGLEDLFAWASEMVADEADPRARRSREFYLRRNILDVIQRNNQLEAREKYSEEINLLQKRVVALLQIISEKVEENASLKQTVVSQYYALAKIAHLEEEVKQLEKLTWYRDAAEEERKHMMDALAKMKKERDFLEELLTTNETENARLAELLSNARMELNAVKSRRWWHRFLGR